MKTATKSTKKTAANTAPAKQTEPLQKEPQSKTQAAVQGGMFLHTDDKWSLAYFNSNDLHCEERELFG
jgi:hypothetical protein